MPLRQLSLSGTPVTDLAPLKGMKLEELYLSEPKADLAPLAGMPLETVGLPDVSTVVNIATLRDIKTVKWIRPPVSKPLPAAEFWGRYDAGEFGKVEKKDPALRAAEEVYRQYRGTILKAAKAGDAKEVEKLTDTFNASIGGRLGLVLVSRSTPGEAVVTLINRQLGPTPIRAWAIKYGDNAEPHVTDITDGDRKLIQMQTGGLRDDRWPDDINILMVVEPAKHAGLDRRALADRILAACGAEPGQSLRAFAAAAQVGAGPSEVPVIRYESNVIAPTRNTPASRNDPARPYHQVLLSIRPIQSPGALDMTEADGAIRWDGREAARGYRVKRLEVEIVITVRSDEPEFVRGVNAIVDREVSAMLAQDGVPTTGPAAGAARPPDADDRSGDTIRG
jgi:hypothetical protein